MIILKFDNYILEKRIGQISANIEVIFAFDIIKTVHADDRSDFSKRNLSGENQTHISNGEIVNLISIFRREISEGIAIGDILDQTNFIIKSLDKELSMVLIAEEISKSYWKIIVKTVFRESEDNSLYVWPNQIVYEK